MKKAHLRCCPHFSLPFGGAGLLQRTYLYVSSLEILGALHPDFFDYPVKKLLIKNKEEVERC